MKKVISFVLCLALCCSVALAEVDLSGMSFDELVALKDKINLAIWNSQEWQEVTVPQGVWLVGEDIPEGHWTISCNTKYARITTGTVLDDTKQSIDTWNSDFCVYESVTNPNYKYFDPGSDKTQIDLDLKSGVYVVIDQGDVVFSPYAGKPSLGFK